MGSGAAVNRGVEAGGARYGRRISQPPSPQALATGSVDANAAETTAAKHVADGLPTLSRVLRTACVLFYRLAADTN